MSYRVLQGKDFFFTLIETMKQITQPPKVNTLLFFFFGWFSSTSYSHLRHKVAVPCYLHLAKFLINGRTSVFKTSKVAPCLAFIDLLTYYMRYSSPVKIGERILCAVNLYPVSL